MQDVVTKQQVALEEDLDISREIHDNYSQATAYVVVMGNKIYLHKLFDASDNAKKMKQSAISKGDTYVAVKQEKMHKNDIVCDARLAVAAKRRRMKGTPALLTIAAAPS